MKIKLLLSSIIFMNFIGCGDTSTVGQTLDSTTENMTDKNEKKEDENKEEDENSEIVISQHNQGKSCLSCHSAPAKGANGKAFLSGGTVYTTLNGTDSKNYADGFTIRLLLDGGSQPIYRVKSRRGTGNFYSKDSALSSSYKFTAQVIMNNTDKNVVNSSKKNSHNTEKYLSCNNCHTATGKNGAPGRVINFFK